MHFTHGVIDQRQNPVRSDSHCAMQAIDRFDVPAKSRVSFGLNTREKADGFLEAGLKESELSSSVGEQAPEQQVQADGTLRVSDEQLATLRMNPHRRAIANLRSGKRMITLKQ